MPQCITCGSELHPERAKKYNYCMAPECQKKNLKGLTMVAVGVNKQGSGVFRTYPVLGSMRWQGGIARVVGHGHAT
jgi:hypothetical protein